MFSVELKPPKLRAKSSSISPYQIVKNKHIMKIIFPSLREGETYRYDSLILPPPPHPLNRVFSVELKPPKLHAKSSGISPYQIVKNKHIMKIIFPSLREGETYRYDSLILPPPPHPLNRVFSVELKPPKLHAKSSGISPYQIVKNKHIMKIIFPSLREGETYRYDSSILPTPPSPLNGSIIQFWMKLYCLKAYLLKLYFVVYAFLLLLSFSCIFP